MNELALFAGAGGGLLGSRLLGWRTVCAVERDPYRQAVLLARQADGVLDPFPIWSDVRTFTIDNLVNASYVMASPEHRSAVDMAARRKCYDEAVRMYDAGLSCGDVADFYGISRQAMWAILKRRGCLFRPQSKYGSDNHFYRGGGSASDRAQNILERAVAKGIIIRRTACDKCGNSGTFTDGRSSIQAHHCDYNRPLDVMWLCQKCHHSWHKHNRPIRRKEVCAEEAERCDIDIITAGFP